MKVYKAYAKVNIFLKITGTRGDYHEIISRFMRVDNLFDKLYFSEKKDNKEFSIVGDFSCQTQHNTIYKSYKALYEATGSQELKYFMQQHSICVDKSIPAFAGLGGGSSDSATFLKMCNDKLSLLLSVEELAEIGLKVGADVPFFIYGYDSANVSGVGEIVEEFVEELLEFEIYTPKVEISTPKVYRSYRKNFFNPIDEVSAKSLSGSFSKDILLTHKLDEINDLYNPAVKEYDELKAYQKDGYFFSGSGSSFFKIKEG